MLFRSGGAVRRAVGERSSEASDSGDPSADASDSSASVGIRMTETQCFAAGDHGFTLSAPEPLATVLFDSLADMSVASVPRRSPALVVSANPDGTFDLRRGGAPAGWVKEEAGLNGEERDRGRSGAERRADGDGRRAGRGGERGDGEVDLAVVGEEDLSRGAVDGDLRPG